MVRRNQRTLAVRIAARAHVAADQFIPGVVYITLGNRKHGHVQRSRRREAAARHQNQRRLVRSCEATLQPVVGKRIAMIRLGHGLGRRRRRAGRMNRCARNGRGETVCWEATHGCWIQRARLVVVVTGVVGESAGARRGREGETTLVMQQLHAPIY